MPRMIMIFLLFYQSFAFAQSGNALKDCSAYIESAESKLDTELFVLVDQTTLFNKRLKQSIANNIKPFIRPSSGITMMQFSAYKMGHYVDVLSSVKLDSKIAQSTRDDTSKPKLVKYDRCMKFQPKHAVKVIGKSLRKAFVTSKLDQSDILFSLKSASVRVRKSEATRKIVLIASDMLEHSSTTTFYKRKMVRKISPEEELLNVEKSNLVADFGGAEVYIIGAGLLPTDLYKKNTGYRSYQVMNQLNAFWKKWFEKSNATLVEFGQPALLNPVE